MQANLRPPSEKTQTAPSANQYSTGGLRISPSPETARAQVLCSFRYFDISSLTRFSSMRLDFLSHFSQNPTAFSYSSSFMLSLYGTAMRLELNNLIEPKLYN